MWQKLSGLEKLLTSLRDSLQKLPVPDSFNRLEKWDFDALIFTLPFIKGT